MTATAVKQSEAAPETQMGVKVFNLEQLRGRYESRTASVIAECELATEMVGGQNADEAGVRVYVKHHLKLEGDKAENAVSRILLEEVGERAVPSETGELEEKMSYGINVIRRDEYGPWLGNWMAKACIKAATSRLGIYKQKIGSKGDMAEMGDLRAYGSSLKNPDHLERVYLLARNSDEAVKTYFQDFKGSVSTPKGRQSIVNTSECAPPGTRFCFEYRYYPGRVTEDDICDIFAAAMVVGLGSCKSFERGKFKVNRLTFEQAAKTGAGSASLKRKTPAALSDSTEPKAAEGSQV